MDRYEGTAHLEWWANRSTCPARIPVRIVPAAGNGTWNATASPPLDRDAKEDLQLLIDAGPHFTLRFDDDAATEVEVAHSGDVSQLLLRSGATSGTGATSDTGA
ncbi:MULTISPECIES: hypothetical protein [Streptomyces]|uniref:hypothetical protein n=1 Tax=Streptomyces TaxID=1883 RepID=UPI002020DFD2|nr:hypothetical protein [Streptomyces sp. MCA2]MCL7491137.1 hypothetical protein [Streptomyces sp. MCA2]